ncbi:DUF1223 domain-containing protein [Stappia sp. GBMRC 2046]|uniref:DUF1223 domain-containing protein n=2 Tax=Stappia sediminis TaxID=2692190 RepID=A0A7X3S7T1_9HYPH|nr:DUF1223 domain-containing protein [Stappia sediminis]
MGIFNASARLGAAILSLAMIFSVPASAGETAVLELFTSQGCSSCPPADKLLEKVADQPGIVALSFPVDYWDYLGWRDTLASPAYSARQRGYAERRGDRSVYTPQIVVNGGPHMVGSDARAIAAHLRAASAMPCDVDVKAAGELIEIEIDGDLPEGTKSATVFFLFVDSSETVQIGRGENTGRTITYTNIVRDMRAVGMWKGGKASFSLPASELERMKTDRFAALVQIEERGRPGPILGAAIH